MTNMYYDGKLGHREQILVLYGLAIQIRKIDAYAIVDLKPHNNLM